MIAIRGATTVLTNEKSEILEETRLMLEKIIKDNNISIDNIISITFTATKDIDAVYPAVAARELNITCAGLLCMQEMNVEDSLSMCIRVLVHTESELKQKDVKHVYLKEAVRLRPDLT